jgi:hypothetical protein
MMNRTALLVAAGLTFAGSALAQGDRKVEYLKEEPPAGSVPYRKVVYVDDGTCPQGQVKEITGGSQEKSIPRKVRCVQRRN